ncbi:REP-associated tyrosine transposase [Thalassotalea mangrovi]|uniref:Transposase n=1 Tax=Thalassotalea mangrovi TaxID=2572245 RepID=A0A4U1B691_9GAMM|nr:transposase [Thalassotalea mangrovi]TKB46044.1 transposase [Thalassotalea mangrovi]
MSRPLRIEYEGALYHVTSRGNERRNIYRDTVDYQMFLTVLTHVCNRFNWIIHAYCLMPNHYHLLLETPEPNLSTGMRQLNGVFTQKFNWRYKRQGHLFQGRYKAILVQRENYFLELCRYIVLNPVRAKGLVSRLDEWRWSSYLSTIGKISSPNWLATDKTLSLFASNRAAATLQYQRFVSQGADVEIWQHLKNQVFLGDLDFVNNALDMLKDSNQSLCEIPIKQKRPAARPLQYYKEIFDTDKYQGISQAYATGAYSMNEIARYFEVHYSTVSRIVAKFKT